MLMARTKKGQYFSFDAVIASIIFIMAFISFLSYWFSLKSALDSKDEEITKEAARVSDTIMAAQYKKINASFFTPLEGMTEDQLRQYFNAPYNISIIADSAYAPVSTLSVIGDARSGAINATNIAKIRRAFIFTNQSGEEIPATMDIYLYR